MPKFQTSSSLIFAPVTAVSATALLVGAAFADPPPADTVIGNQAAATYTSNGQEVTVQSNLVETIVNEVYGLDLTASQARNAAPGGLVFFPHTLSNNGNTDDIFDLVTDPTPGGDGFALTNIEIFIDADQDGVPDNLTPITETPAILAGGSLGLVVRATVPATATTGQVNDFTLTATSQGDGAQTATNTDALTITTDGIIDVEKDQALTNDADGNGAISVGDTITVNLEYSNTGIGDATNVILEDVLPTTNADGDPITLTYAVGSGVWSDAPTVTLTEAGGDTEATNSQGQSIQYSEPVPGTIRALIDLVPAGRSATLSFDYVITAAPQGQIENVATVESDTQTPTPSNTSPVDVAPAAAMTLADAAGVSALGAGVADGAGNLDAGDPSTTDADGALNDVVTNDSSVFPGDTLTFDFVLTNLGNGVDTFSLDIPANTFPTGAQFDFVASDGLTPIIGDEVMVAAGASTHVQLLVTLPVGTPASAAPTGFDAQIAATSQADPGVSNTTTALFNGAVLAPTIDLANTNASGDPDTGIGTGVIDNGGAPFVTLPTDPGTQVTFPLQATVPAGSPANTFDLLTGPLPAGWTVEFFSTDGTPITNTGPLVPTATNPAEFDYVAVVTVPAGASPATEGILFTTTSPSNGATDSVLNAVAVNEIVDLSLETDVNVQAAPGGIAVIAHTITNLGNSVVTGGALDLGPTDPFTDEGMVAALFYDANDDGVLDAGDPVISDISAITGSDGAAGLSPGEAARIFVRVQVPSTTGLGLVETGDFAVNSALTTALGAATDANLANNTVIDTVTIVSGDISFVKEQAVDFECDGVPDTAFSQTNQNADPGHCLVYRLEANNTGFTNATNVVIRDTTPSFTTMETSCATDCTPSLEIDGAPAAIAVVPADEAAGSVASSTPPQAGFTLVPGARAEMVFTVQIDE